MLDNIFYFNLAIVFFVIAFAVYRKYFKKSAKPLPKRWKRKPEHFKQRAA